MPGGHGYAGWCWWSMTHNLFFKAILKIERRTYCKNHSFNYYMLQQKMCYHLSESIDTVLAPKTLLLALSDQITVYKGLWWVLHHYQFLNQEVFLKHML